MLALMAFGDCTRSKGEKSEVDPGLPKDAGLYTLSPLA